MNVEQPITMGDKVLGARWSPRRRVTGWDKRQHLQIWEVACIGSEKHTVAVCPKRARYTSHSFPFTSCIHFQASRKELGSFLEGRERCTRNTRANLPDARFLVSDPGVDGRADRACNDQRRIEHHGYAAEVEARDLKLGPQTFVRVDGARLSRVLDRVGRAASDKGHDRGGTCHGRRT